MDFKSQIATTRDQSEILLSLGLKPETADMVYHHTNSRVKSWEWELQTKPPTVRGKYWTPERIAKLEPGRYPDDWRGNIRLPLGKRCSCMES